MKYLISIIWFLLSGLLIYNVFYPDDSVSTILYIILCWICSAPLAGCIIYDSLTAMEKDGNDLEEEKHPVLVAGGVIIGVVVSIVDFFFVKEASLDFFCDLVEIGFGYFAVVSYYVGLVLTFCTKDSKFFEDIFENIKQNRERKRREAEERERRERWEEEEERREAEMERLRRIQVNSPSLRMEMIRSINRNLAKVIAENLMQEHPFINFGLKGSEERYYVAEYPISKLKPKTERFVENLAAMTEEERSAFQRKYAR